MITTAYLLAAFLAGGLLYRVRGGVPWARLLSTTGGRLVFTLPTACLPLAFGCPWWLQATLFVFSCVAICPPNEGREDLGTAPRNVARYIIRPLRRSTWGDAAGMALIGAKRGGTWAWG